MLVQIQFPTYAQNAFLHNFKVKIQNIPKSFWTFRLPKHVGIQRGSLFHPRTVTRSTRYNTQVKSKLHLLLYNHQKNI